MLLLVMFLLFRLSCWLVVATGHTIDHWNMVNCTTEVINKYADRRTVVFFTEERGNNSIWDDVVKKTTKPFVVISEQILLPGTAEIMVVLFAHIKSDYSVLIEKLRKGTIFIIVGNDLFETHGDMSRILLQFHHSKMIYNVFLLTGNNKVHIYTSFPYGDFHCGELGPPTEVNIFQEGKFRRENNIFRQEKYWNMYGCTLTIFANPQIPDASVTVDEKSGEISFRGAAKLLLEMLSKKLNFKPKIVLSHHIDPSMDCNSCGFYNDAVDRITKYLINGQVDFAMGSFSRLVFSDSNLVLGRETHYECYTWALPIKAGKKRPTVLNYIDEFSFDFWLMFLISLVIAVLVVVGVSRALNVNRDLQSLGKSSLYVFSTISNQPYPINPKPWSLRIFIAHWSAYVLIISTAYQASLWSFMTIPWETHEINSLEDLSDSRLEIGGAQQMLNILRAIQSNNEHITHIIDRFKVIPTTNFSEIVDRIISKRDFALFGERRHLKSFSRDIDKYFTTDKMFFMEGCALQPLTSPIMFASESPFHKPVNTMMTRILQSGLMPIAHFTMGDGVQLYVEQGEDRSNSMGTMKLDNIRGLLCLLFFGYGISFVVYVSEIIFANNKKGQRKLYIIFGPKLYLTQN